MGKSDTSRFGALFEEALARHSMRKIEAAERLSVSRAYVSKIARGKGSVLPERIDAISEKLGFSEEETRRLHRAAALDAGFRLDLPDDF
ncbi:helix-turn-helix domain-containing protein [Tranquillimonas alkanivorans]|uniref:Helix-turn-helix domain-containing protein n=1 Tax=Tranquillimonas alkanivorans TaxID=441119 RepID=A0A1I5TWD1_9RHOB|nr:helix-turn-helix transcriptional regulator [Tranquillimonas alkanivorans]SFP87365.1 Helix-turn-helix domain-containing protein [Tranquillimonas alkanivorans]